MKIIHFIKNVKVVQNLIKLVLSVILILFLVQHLSINSIYLAVKNANKLLIFCAFALLPLNIYLQFLRWRLLCLTVEKSSNTTILKSIFLGIAAGLITPLKAGEFIGRASIFDFNKLKTYTSLSVYDRIISMLVTFVFGIVFGIFTVPPIFNVFFNYLIPLSIFVFIFLFSLFLLIRFKIFNFLNKIANFFINLFLSINFYNNIKLILLAVFFFLTYVFQFALLLAAFNGLGSIFNFISAGILVFFTNTIIPPITLGELGIREGAAVYYANYFNYIASTGFSSSIILFSINIIIPSIIGLFFYMKEKS